MSAAPQILPTLFIPHGGGPCFFFEPRHGPPDMWDRMAAYLRAIAASLPTRPQAALVISAHWMTPQPTVHVGARPSLLFDYYGFPEHTYRLTYPAPGAPALAQEIVGLLTSAGIAAATEAERGFDHGIFIPFLLIYPQADLPIVQLSLQQDLDPEAHLALGRALAPLRERGVLIVGSGLSYHNLREIMAGRAAANTESERFDAWLTETVADSDPERRNQRLAAWHQAPSARACHPSDEHLVPLLVAAGAAGRDPGRQVYSDRILGKAYSGFQFG